jgi:hypothetical protein
MGMTAALVLALTACSDDSDGNPEAEGTPTPSEITIDCAEFEDTAALITKAQTDLYSGTGGPEVIETLVTELEALEDGAPADVRVALSDMADAFREAESLLENPTPRKQRELAELAPKLANQSQTITDYVVEQCE